MLGSGSAPDTSFHMYESLPMIHRAPNQP